MSDTERLIQVAACPEDAGGRLDAVLARRCDDLTRSRLQQLIRDGRVTLGGATISEPSYRVKPGQTFAIIVPESAPSIPIGEPISLSIVYEDEFLIVIDKPAGLVVHPAPGNPNRTLVNALIAHCREGLSGLGDLDRPGIVHRLDKDTSGLMVAAKTDAAYLGLVDQFKNRAIDRAYTAIVWGAPLEASGEISGNIGRSPRNRKKMAVLKTGGKQALTRYRVVRRYGSPSDPIASRIECRLATGRTHQIRVHLTARGHPIIGDQVYGRGRRRRKSAPRAAAEMKRQALHAHLIGFDHPITGKHLEFTSELPSDISALTKSLEIV